VRNLKEARDFYGNILGCSEGRSAADWVDFNFYGHQLVAHLVHKVPEDNDYNLVDGHDVPVPHFGVVLSMTNWQQLAVKLSAAGTKFVIEPGIRFKGEVGEQATMFFRDPSGNALEFKAFEDLNQLFANKHHQRRLSAQKRHRDLYALRQFVMRQKSLRF
jgi:extradiol dioxygenase family protein